MILGFDAIGRVALGGTASSAVAYSLSCDVGDYAVTGKDIHDPLFPGTAGAFTLAGQAATAKVTTPLGAEAFAFTGIDAGLIYGQQLTADVGAFTLAGQNALEDVDYQNFAEAGTFEMIGRDIGKGLIVSFARRLTRGGKYSDQITTGPSLIT